MPLHAAWIGALVRDIVPSVAKPVKDSHGFAIGHHKIDLELGVPSAPSSFG